jgi:hypothetical protein
MENNNDLQERIENIFESAGLSHEDRMLWVSRLAASDEPTRMAFIAIFETDGEMIHFFTRDLRERIEAGDDATKLAAALETEREYFRQFLAQSKKD